MDFSIISRAFLQTEEHGGKESLGWYLDQFFVRVRKKVADLYVRTHRFANEFPHGHYLVQAVETSRRESGFGDQTTFSIIRER